MWASASSAAPGCAGDQACGPRLPGDQDGALERVRDQVAVVSHQNAPAAHHVAFDLTRAASATQDGGFGGHAGEAAPHSAAAQEAGEAAPHFAAAQEDGDVSGRAPEGYVTRNERSC